MPEQATRDLNNLVVSKLATQNQDMKLRRTVNAADAVDKQDYVTLNDLQTKLAPSAYTDTTDASKITTGILPSKQLPNPDLNTLGGIKAIQPVAHEFVQSIDTQGNPILAQPSFSDLSGAPFPSVQNVVTGSRAIGTVYHNTTGRPMCVTVTPQVTMAAGTQAGLNIFSDASVTPTTQISLILLQTGATAGSTVFVSPVTFIVLPGNYYSATQFNLTTSMTIFAWVEWY